MPTYDMLKPVDDPQNLLTTGNPIDVYTCPSMQLPRTVPQSPCEKLGVGSYIISSGTDDMRYAPLNGAFAIPRSVEVSNHKYVDSPYMLGLNDITDGTSKTFLVGENNYRLEQYEWDKCSELNGTTRWGDQTWANGYWYYAWGHIAWDLHEMKGRTIYNRFRFESDELSVFHDLSLSRVFRSDHPGGAQFVLLDGSVCFVPETIEYPVLRALVTRAGEEPSYAFQ